MTSRYATLRREELAILLPELLLAGQLIDRSAMARCIGAFGRAETTRIAVEEWHRRGHDLQWPAGDHEGELGFVVHVPATQVAPDHPGGAS